MLSKIRFYGFGLLGYVALAASLSICLQLGAGADIVCGHLLVAVLLDLHLRDIAGQVMGRS